MKQLLQRIFPYKDLGWKEIGEDFVRFQLLRHPFGTILLHRLYAPIWHPECHDHPWGFTTIILWGGYWEETSEGKFWRRPLSVLYRPATFAHNVATKGVCWSLVFAGKKSREWAFVRCGP